MNLAHLHLVLNHVPVIGAMFASLLLLYGAVRRNDALARAAMVSLVVLALVAIPAYLTGEPAEKVVANHPGVASHAIEAHEDAAGAALAAMELMGAACLALLIAYRQRPLPLKAVAPALAFAVVLAGMMAWTANLGGKIHHTEIAAGASATLADSEHD